MKKLILDNRLTLITENIKEAKTSSVVVTVKIGPSDEPSGMAGISHFVEHMTFKGTRSIPDPTELSAVIENVGG
ncbi:MAG: peptidase M16, partial [Chloroflexi bacterium]|nr:peptidase M16 [Chloroflexota bacterium]